MMSPQKGASRIGECSIDMAFACQDELSTSKLPRLFTDDNRYPSLSSSLDSNNGDICRICHCEGALDQPLITPCYCSGSLRYVHQTCLQQWIKSSNTRSCELCKFQFIMQTKVKPFNEWEYLEMSGLERKKLLCAMLFHIIAMTCVCWSLYVLIDRTLDEVKKGHLEWPFWTKLIVVGIGFMGGIVFMYIQCRAYFVLCKRWKAYNRVIYVQNAPEKSTPLTSKLLSPSSDTGPSCSFKTYSDSCIDKVTESRPSCIDIKGVRKLRIIFGDENQIRFHHDKREEKNAMQGELYEESSCNSLKDNSHSVRIQIGGNNSRPRDLKENGGVYNSALCPVECREEQETGSDQSVVKLQFKNAVIVIESGAGRDAASNQVKLVNKCIDEPDARSPAHPTPWNGIKMAASPKRRFSSEEYLDLETKYRDKVANELNESPTSRLLINEHSVKVPHHYLREKIRMKDWRSSEDLVRKLP